MRHPLPAFLLAACCLLFPSPADAREVSFAGQGCWITMEVPSGWSYTLEEGGSKLSMVRHDSLGAVEVYTRRLDVPLEEYGRRAARALSRSYRTAVRMRSDTVCEVEATGRENGPRYLLVNARPGALIVLASSCDAKTTARVAKLLRWR